MKKKKKLEKFWKKNFEKIFWGGFGHEKTVLDRKISRFWCSKKNALNRIPRYKRTALKEDCPQEVLIHILRIDMTQTPVILIFKVIF